MSPHVYLPDATLDRDASPLYNGLGMGRNPRSQRHRQNHGENAPVGRNDVTAPIPVVSSRRGMRKNAGVAAVAIFCFLLGVMFLIRVSDMSEALRSVQQSAGEHYPNPAGEHRTGKTAGPAVQRGERRLRGGEAGHDQRQERGRDLLDSHPRPGAAPLYSLRRRRRSSPRTASSSPRCWRLLKATIPFLRSTAAFSGRRGRSGDAPGASCSRKE